MIKLPDKVYDVLKWIVIIVIPATTTLFVTFDSVFNWGIGNYVAPISSAVCAFLGAILGISTIEYYKDEE